MKAKIDNKKEIAKDILQVDFTVLKQLGNI